MEMPTKAKAEVTFRIYDCRTEMMLSRDYADRQEANDMCDYLEEKRGGLYVPVKFVNGKQIANVY